ncbi:hypothetical protein LF95_15260 [Thalassospira sp. TSL5-1]|nr:hypothetical protein LF95_15260 [Thalassospira sp. TSL5-1]
MPALSWIKEKHLRMVVYASLRDDLNSRAFQKLCQLEFWKGQAKGLQTPTIKIANLVMIALLSRAGRLKWTIIFRPMECPNDGG